MDYFDLVYNLVNQLRKIATGQGIEIYLMYHVMCLSSTTYRIQAGVEEEAMAVMRGDLEFDLPGNLSFRHYLLVLAEELIKPLSQDMYELAIEPIKALKCTWRQ